MKIIELKQAPVILVEFPEVVDNLQILNDIGRPYLSYYTKPVNAHRAYLPDGDYVVLGYISDLTEEQFAECVADNGNGDYKNYVGSWGGFEKAKDSFYSLLESEDVYTENPLKSMADKIGHGTLDSFDQDYAEAQSRTIDTKRTIVIYVIK